MEIYSLAVLFLGFAAVILALGSYYINQLYKRWENILSLSCAKLEEEKKNLAAEKDALRAEIAQYNTEHKH